MTVYRYMSNEEFQKFSAGLKIIGKKHHDAKTNSKGICFLQEMTHFTDASGRTHDWNPVSCYEFLLGIVSEDVLVEFETNTELNKTYGVYADPCGGWYDLIEIEELCVDSYDISTMKAVRYCVDFDNIGSERNKWYEYNV